MARDLLARCVAGKPPKELPRAMVEEPCGKALFGILAEGLADRFEPSLCDIYARLFARVVSHCTGSSDAPSLVARYNRVRRPRPVRGDPHRIFVLSRVTLGADVAVTSVMLDAAKRRFPHAEVVFVGPLKNYELFAGDPHVHHAEIAYPSDGLRARLAVGEKLKALLAGPDCLVVDPDSRLTQLGLLPVCPEDDYHFFESRAYGSESDRALPELAAQWAAETLGVTDVKPYVALGRPIEHKPYVAVSFGVGQNTEKRVPDPFEQELLAMLAGLGWTICIDTGAGGEEAARVRSAVGRSGVQASLWQGTFSGFASIIAASRLYIGYDSAGQHVAAACGVPLISVFTGFPTPRMFDRWRPVGENCAVIRLDRPDATVALQAVEEVLIRYRAVAGNS